MLPVGSVVEHAIQVGESGTDVSQNGAFDVHPGAGLLDVAVAEAVHVTHWLFEHALLGHAHGSASEHM